MKTFFLDWKYIILNPKRDIKLQGFTDNNQQIVRSRYSLSRLVTYPVIIVVGTIAKEKKK